MTAIFAWLGARRWLLELAGAAAIVAGMLWYHAHVFDAGIAAQKSRDDAALARATAAADAKTLQLQQAASAAEVRHAQEVAQISQNLAAHPADPVRLCISPAAVGAVSEAPAAVAGTAAASAAAPGVFEVSGSGFVGQDRPGPIPGPDIGPVLRDLAAAADFESANVRESQTREGVAP